jgi:hypothetical protein
MCWPSCWAYLPDCGQGEVTYPPFSFVCVIYRVQSDSLEEINDQPKANVDSSGERQAIIGEPPGSGATCS